MSADRFFKIYLKDGLRSRDRNDPEKAVFFGGEVKRFCGEKMNVSLGSATS
jgi:hypothetical protein